MTRLLGIDFGERRIGLAVSTEDVVLPLRTLERRNDREAVETIVGVAREQSASRLVVGEPLRVDGTRGAAAERARSFAARLERRSGLPVSLHPETLTTVAARERLRDAGVDLRRFPERLDAVAAQVLLEDFLRTGAPERAAGAGTSWG
ncbi:MAG TPA: Holliday junction resolvase RuvX [Thermoanaerobaculia bacterium]|nr:Holliday junction resolvase RuvX [Thermoanaerobaculia bacterium]